jgi:hypothetical protein
MKARNLPRFLTLALTPLILLGCEAVFTYTPLKFLQRPPSSLTAEERLTYGENALASGDTQAMIDAYEALDKDTSDAAQYLAAQLAIEISGISDLLLGVVDGSTTLPTSGDTKTLTDWLDDNGGEATATYLAAAGEKLLDADPAQLTTMDYVYGSLGLALEAATQNDGTIDFTKADADKLDDAQAFVQGALTGMSPDDPSYSFLSSYNDFLQSI